MHKPPHRTATWLTTSTALVLSICTSSPIFSGCTRVGDDDLRTRLDVDGDGITIDQDCDDNDPTVAELVLFWEDADGDGYGTGPSFTACRTPAGFANQDGDCDDINEDISPSAPEICNNHIDEDCDQDPTDCRFVGDVSVETAALVVGGELFTDQFGGKVRWIPDIFYNGHADFLVGANRADTFRWSGDGRAGVVYAISASTRGSVAANAVSTGFIGDTEWDVFGHTLSLVGDLFGRGNLGVAVGAPEHDGNGEGAGMVRFFDFNAGRTVDDPLLVGLPIDILGSGPNADLGDLLAGGLDITGDDVHDVIVGGYGAGRDLFVLAGPLLEGGVVDDLALVRFDLVAAGYSSWVDISLAPDLNGNGLNELVIVARDSDDATSLHLMETLTDTSSLAEDEPFWVSPGSATGEITGTVLGDLTGDGHPELAVSHGGHAHQIVILDCTTTPPTVVSRWLISNPDVIRVSVAGTDDVTGDGIPDIWVGVPQAEDNLGVVYLLSGALRGEHNIDSAIASITGSGRFGSSVDASTDADNDGFPDLLVGATYSSAGSADAGAAYFFRGVGP